MCLKSLLNVEYHGKSHYIKANPKHPDPAEMVGGLIRRITNLTVVLIYQKIQTQSSTNLQ